MAQAFGTEVNSSGRRAQNAAQPCWLPPPPGSQEQPPHPRKLRDSREAAAPLWELGHHWLQGGLRGARNGDHGRQWDGGAVCGETGCVLTPLIVSGSPDSCLSFPILF